ncbi:MAG: VWA domain-containing protein [Acidobacteria bacterium]|nr:VWA domain-containing protein [Acidobacteriota bacterium]
MRTPKIFMTFLNPLALIYALSIGVLLLLHFRKPKKMHWVSDLQLWQDIEQESMQRKSIFRIIKRNRLLILQILLLAAIVLALARPLITLWGGPSRTLLLIVDCSASMTALEDGIPRFELAREKALDLIEDAHNADKILLVQARPRMNLHTYTGSEKAAIREALNTMTATHGSVDIGRIVTTAVSSLENTESVEIYIIDDGTQAPPSLNTLPEVEVHTIRIGKTGDNVAIANLSIRENPFSAHDRQVFCEIENFSDREHIFPFDIFLDGTVLITETIRLNPKQSERIVTDIPAGANGILHAVINSEDAMEIDNEAFAVLDSHAMSVLLGTSGNLFLEKALQVNPRIALTVLKPEECTSERFGRGYDAIILDGFQRPDLPPGNYFLIRSESGRTTGGSSLRAIRSLTSPRPEHPILAFVDPAGITLDRATPLDLTPSDAVILEGNGYPLLAANETGIYRTVKLGFDIRDSSLPLTYAFPVLLSNILGWLEPEDSGPGNQTAAGSAIRLRLPAYDASKDLVVVTPDGKTFRATAGKGILSFAETESTGIYTIRYSRAIKRFAVNLSSRSESNIKPVDTVTDEHPHSPDRPATAGTGRETWRWLLLASLLLLALEWRRYQGAA